MMKKRMFAGLVALVLMVSGFSVYAEVLEPVLRAGDVVGTVQVQRDGKGDFVAIEEGKTYPYGSRFRSGPESSVSLALSSLSAVKVLADTELVFTEGIRNRNEKTVRLVAGEVEAELDPKFGEEGNVLNIQAGKTIAQAVGTNYRVATRYEQNLNIVVIRVLAGIVRVLGENFQIVELEADEWVSLLSPPDDSFTRLKTLQGEFEVTVKDEDKSDRSIPTEKDSVVKIWQRVVPGTGERVISAVFSDPSGELIETVTVTFGPNEYADFVQDVMDDDGKLPWEDLEGVERPRRQSRGGDEGEEGDNPIPPDSILDELQAADRDPRDLNAGVGAGVTVVNPGTVGGDTGVVIVPPAPPTVPTPTPVGNL